MICVKKLFWHKLGELEVMCKLGVRWPGGKGDGMLTGVRTLVQLKLTPCRSTHDLATEMCMNSFCV
jgi:hypothetical protein